MEPIALTKYSHGSGCGCKISPALLDQILRNNEAMAGPGGLLVGNDCRDDAAVFDLGNGTAMIATTDFFMPVVDDPFEFGRIAAANAISDIYAMGGRPVLALAILGWPVNILAPQVAHRVVEGGRSMCLEAGIPLAGGHSIDCPEPIFGLVVNGLADIRHIKRNNTARPGNLLYLTKPIGVGILTTAEKKGMLEKSDRGIAAAQMMQLNRVGEVLGRLEGVTAMTDVTGFGLLGHLLEMTTGSGNSAELYFNHIPWILPNLEAYILKGCVPGGTFRNWDSYGDKVSGTGYLQQQLIADPQTSGGLLIALEEKAIPEFEAIFRNQGLGAFLEPIGRFIPLAESSILVV
ncbi:MAG TPA: selenide, water dikinase SelD [Chitinophagaceae bacterium]|nr:selenide, water dikinase SelD [Chitinophagaceae bacterium]